MSTSPQRHPVRLLVLIALVAGIGVALRNALADKGGTYDPAEPAA